MKKNIYHLFFFMILFTFSIKVKSQDCNGYTINFNQSSVNREVFMTVFSKFDYEKYRPYYYDFTMKFNNGIEITLTSAERLKKNGCITNTRNDHYSLEYLKLNINSFQYNEKQGTIMTLYNIINK